MTDTALAHTIGSPLDALIVAWLQEKSGRSGSVRTAVYNNDTQQWRGAYPDTMSSFRATLAQHNLDLDGDPSAVALVAQQWADERSTESHTTERVAPTTFNQRLAIVSSFYDYVIKKGLTFVLETNPITRVQRRRVQRYSKATPIEPAEMRQRLAAIDRSTLLGKRDYALLAVGFATGQRANELAALTMGDVGVRDAVTLTFRRVKGGETVRKQLPPRTGRALLDYLTMLYGSSLQTCASEKPVWVSVTGHTPGQSLGYYGVRYVCKKYLGTTQVHTLRHSYAHGLLKSGAPINEIKQLLGHKSLATTGEYLEALDRAHSPYVARLEDLFLGEEE